MKIGKNDPCPCGSGKKYKRCCLQKQAGQASNVVDYEWQKIRRTEGEVVHLTLQQAFEWYGPDFLKKAWKKYAGKGVPMEEAPEFGTSFVPWAVFNYIPTGRWPGFGSLPKMPAALRLLLAGDDLDSFQKKFIREICDQPYSYYVVREVKPGMSMVIEDVFTRAEHVVKERQGSLLLRKGDIIYTRVLSMGGTTIMVGMAPTAFPPDYHLRLLAIRDSFPSGEEAISREALHLLEATFRKLYFVLKDRLFNPPPIVLTNTDGDPLAFVTLTYELNCPPQAAFEKLRSLDPFAEDGELLADADWDEGGALQQVAFSWLKAGNKKHSSWENTVMGSISIASRSLTVQVNSAKRSKKIRSEIAKRLGDLAILKNSVIESAEKALEEQRDRKETSMDRRRRKEHEELKALPEVQAQLKSMMQKHWDEWVNMPIPALMGQTPLQASISAAGKERLEALLADFERKGERMADPLLVPDVESLRRRLGM